MRRHETIKLGELIKQSISSNKLDDGLDKVRAKALWSQIAGDHISKATTEISINKSTLYVSISSSIIRSEIMLIKSELVKRINKELGRRFITDLIVR